ncbi:NRDE family protein [Marinomonas pollencensis]|uniref:Transport and Golgi organization protein 2 n=1 Tax=Marinomonas pollencensis TaxID=491954 RepID=A0A3E0DBS4_9GAMM|nr:NRDE family protein [Marinomonas pollencensis]REG79432.1 transport and Golgi organization protein 2 [Marinomonas pollencensis]
MCSVSWLLHEEGYQLFFNRDEQKHRALALPPQHLSLSGVSVLMPIDPVANGSWISVNEFGLTLCLLNNYQGQVPSGQLISRGQLVKRLSSEANIKTLTAAFDTLELSRFAPFTLLAFDPQLTRSEQKVMAFEWNGLQAAVFPEWSPRFSSGVDLKSVQQARGQAYKDCIEQGESCSRLLALHKSHDSEQLHHSFCMHREDAHTVSFTHVEVTPYEHSMSYLGGAPCENLTTAALALQRVSLPRHTRVKRFDY